MVLQSLDLIGLDLAEGIVVEGGGGEEVEALEEAAAAPPLPAEFGEGDGDSDDELCLADLLKKHMLVLLMTTKLDCKCVTVMTW
jgi:hypothetical protein